MFMKIFCSMLCKITTHFIPIYKANISVFCSVICSVFISVFFYATTVAILTCFQEFLFYCLIFFVVKISLFKWQ